MKTKKPDTDRSARVRLSRQMTVQEYRQIKADDPLKPVVIKEAPKPYPLLRACVYGQAVGDALGVPFEFRPRGSFECAGMVGHGTHGQPAGTWSDDTSMTLAVCDSYRELGRVDADDVRARFEAWYGCGAYSIDGVFDVGGTTARALERRRGCAGERDNGNGSLMRTVPLAFTDASDDDVRAVSAVTHAHETSTEACVTAVCMARALMGGASPLEAAEVVGLAWLASEPRDRIKSGGYVLDTLHAAVWCLLRSRDYRGCVLDAVNLGEDTDTTAAVAGALAGIAYGEEGIPAEWMRGLRGRDVIDACLF